MRRPDEDLTPEEVAELGALLLAERPAPSPAFTATLDARVAERFPRPTAAAPGVRLREALRRPLLPALATAAATLIAVTIALQAGDGGPAVRRPAPTSPPSAGAEQQAAKPHAAAPDAALPDKASGSVTEQAPAAPKARALALPRSGSFGAADRSARKVERAATIALGAPADHVEDVAQGVLGVVARFDGIVDSSSVAADSESGGTARFALRLPAARLGDALGELSRLPHAHVISRTDDTVDVNQPYVSIRRRLASARAERAGLLRALRAADTEDEMLRLRARLDAVERTIAYAERAQRGLDRRIAYSRVDLTVGADEGGAGDEHGAFTPGRAFNDAGRVLAVTAGVIVIAAAALVPVAIVLACVWPLALALRRRRREQALDAA